MFPAVVRATQQKVFHRLSPRLNLGLSTASYGYACYDEGKWGIKMREGCMQRRSRGMDREVGEWSLESYNSWTIPITTTEKDGDRSQLCIHSHAQGPGKDLGCD